MALISLSEFKETLRVGDLYADDLLQGVMTAAEDIVLAQLVQYRNAVNGILEVGVGTFRVRTVDYHTFEVGQGVTFVGLVPGALNGQATVTAVGLDSSHRTLGPVPSGHDARNTITVSKAHGQTPTADHTDLVPPATVYDSDQRDVYDAVEPVREAALAVAVDVWQSRVAPGGQLEAVDFTPGPYRLGRSLMTRVSGLLGPYLNVSGLVG